MELVYLWVEKNDVIKGTDFNFGSKYIFSFKKDNKGNKGVLSVKDNPYYIENFYSDKINISAIVGKNGTGKSQLLRLIWNGYIDTKQYFAIFKSRDSLKFIGIKDKKFKISSNKLSINIKWNEESIKNLTNLFYTNESICLNSTEKSKFVSMECYFKNIIDMNSISAEEIKEASQDEGSTYHQEAEGNSEEGLTQEEKTTTIFDGDSPIPHIVEIANEIYTYSNIKEALHTKIFEQIFNVIYDDDIKWFNDFNKPNILKIFRNEYNYRNNFNYDIKDIGITDNLLVDIFSTIEWKINLSASDKNKRITDILEKYREELLRNERNNILKQQKLFLEEIEKTEFKKLVEPLRKICEYFFKLENNNSSLYININDKNKDLIKYFLKNYRFFLEKIPESKSILHFSLEPKMSSGHFIIIQTFAMLYEKINQIEDENILLLLDEIEVFLHPNWQKKFLNLLISFLSSKFKDKKFHIILATHSPFLLSDIPKSNVVFLGNEKVEFNQTFGANIHTLLSDSFFMEGGLMGEFAKDKIQKIKRFYRKVTKYKDNQKIKESYKIFYDEKKQKEFWDIKSIIGEPFLQTVIKNYLDEIEIILFENKAKKIAIERFIDEFGKETVSEVMNSAKN